MAHAFAIGAVLLLPSSSVVVVVVVWQSLTLRLSVKAVEGLDQFEKVHLAAGCFWG